MDIKRLWPIHTVQTWNMQYDIRVQVYGEVLCLKFYSVFSESSSLFNGKVEIMSTVWLSFFLFKNLI